MQSTVITAILAAIASVNAATFNIVAASGAPAPFTGVPASATVGDILSFDLGGNHAVVDVSQDVYNTCKVESTTAPLIGLTSNGLPTPGFSYTLTTPGTYYIVCPVGDHCSHGGMKFTLTVAPSAGGNAGATSAVATATSSAAATTKATTTAAAASSTVAATTKSGSSSVSAFSFLTITSTVIALLM
ncbi:UNVERIFIED_CONTAM: hypothetical protein HDU68_008110 [Siphonaria sp. JEL0065]|nr:hypothetical protein HDU68_008110 [Siphonaria sp. JEL0065]